MTQEKKIKANLLATAGDTGAAHFSDQNDEKHAVALWNLSVLIVPDGDFWFAQGIEINYGAQGDSAEDAKKNFQEGLVATINQHLKIYGNIEKILKFASPDILKEAADNKPAIKRFAWISLHEVLAPEAQQKIPFDGIDYRVLQAAA